MYLKIVCKKYTCREWAKRLADPPLLHLTVPLPVCGPKKTVSIGPDDDIDVPLQFNLPLLIHGLVLFGVLYKNTKKIQCFFVRFQIVCWEFVCPTYWQSDTVRQLNVRMFCVCFFKNIYSMNYCRLGGCVVKANKYLVFYLVIDIWWYGLTNFVHSAKGFSYVYICGGHTWQTGMNDIQYDGGGGGGFGFSKHNEMR